MGRKYPLAIAMSIVFIYYLHQRGDSWKRLNHLFAEKKSQMKRLMIRARRHTIQSNEYSHPD